MTPTEFKLIRKTVIGATQADLASALGVTRDAVAKWESGARPIGRTTELALISLAGSDAVDSVRRQLKRNTKKEKRS